MATAGKKTVSYNTTLSTANAQQTIIADGAAACQGGKIFVQNPHTSANVFIGLAGDTNLSVSSRIGWWLAPGAGLIIDDPHNNALTAVSDTNSTPLTCYAIFGG